VSKQPASQPTFGRTQRIAIVANPDKARAKQEIPRLIAWLKRRGITGLATKNFAGVDAVITLGGDGTILSIAPAAAEAGVPVLGVNVGWLGFMTAVELSRLYPALEAWLDGKWTVSERLMLEVTPPRMKKSVPRAERCGHSGRINAATHHVVCRGGQRIFGTFSRRWNDCLHADRIDRVFDGGAGPGGASGRGSVGADAHLRAQFYPAAGGVSGWTNDRTHAGRGA
jgi:hypothetical protein